MILSSVKSFLWLVLFVFAVFGNSAALRAQLCCQGYHDTEYHCTGPGCNQIVYAHTSCIHAQYSGYTTNSGYVSCCGTNWFALYAGSRCYVAAPEQASLAPSYLFARTFYIRDCSGKYVLARVGGQSTS